MSNHRHRFQRLNDTALFCECGEVRQLAEQLCQRPHYYPTWVWPYPYTAPYQPNWYPTITTVGTTSAPFPDGSSVTYTLSTGGN